MHVEEARPERGRKRKSVAEDEGDVTAVPAAKESGNAKIGDRASKRKRKSDRNEDGVLPGVELEGDRRVKRGWQESSSKTKQKSMKSSDASAEEKDASARQDEKSDSRMIFRAKVPQNKAGDAADASKSKGKDKRKKKGDKTVEVKEYEKNTPQPTFLRNSKPDSHVKRASEYVEGKGWVDDQGNAVEPEVNTRSTRRRSRQESDLDPEKPNPENARPKKSTRNAKSNERQPTASAQQDPEEPTLPSITKTDTTSKNPSALESLFKRPGPSSKSTKRPSPIKTTFSFFTTNPPSDSEEAPLETRPQPTDPSPVPIPDDPDNPAETTWTAVDSDHDAFARLKGTRSRTTTLTLPPATPFSKRDVEERGMRSAAPTPDTAAIGRRMKVPWNRSVSREADEPARGADDAAEGDARVKREESGENEFERQFYEERGGLNRAWKARRREGKKEKRQERNRSGGGLRGVE